MYQGSAHGYHEESTDDVDIFLGVGRVPQKC